MPMKPALLATVLCCAASAAAAADGFDPAVKDATLDATHRNQAHETPACRTDRPDALVVSARLQDGRTFLTLVNPMGDLLRYKAWMRRAGSGRFDYTSSCPVLSKHRLAFEDWPFAIDELVLAGFELEPEVAAGGDKIRMECR